MEGVQLDQKDEQVAYLIQQRKNAERVALYQVKAALVVLVLYERPL